MNVFVPILAHARYINSTVTQVIYIINAVCVNDFSKKSLLPGINVEDWTYVNLVFVERA